jgi:ElaB/YqjD/DUF883 family membrane-anchored ribosome-binding protein
MAEGSGKMVAETEDAKLREKFDAVREDVADIARIARSSVGERLQAARQKMSGVEHWVEEHPSTFLGLGLGVGFLIGLIVGRNSK